MVRVRRLELRASDARGRRSARLSYTLKRIIADLSGTRRPFGLPRLSASDEMAIPRRFELRASAFVARRSIQLSYGTMALPGGIEPPFPT